MLTQKELYEWRQRGATYQEMADVEGVSRQDIYMKVKSYEAKLKGKRGREFDINKIVYKGIYEYFRDNMEVTPYSFTTDVFGYASKKTQCVKSFLLGEHETLFKIRQIKRLMGITGKTFEELFERRRVK